MGTVTIILDPNPTHVQDHEKVVTGSLSLSNSYATGGDSFTPGQLGLNILTDLELYGTLAVYEVVQSALPVVGAGTSVKIVAYGTGAGSGGVFVQLTGNPDLSADVVRFRAHGF